MKALTTLGVSLAMTVAACAAEVESGLKTGDAVDAFQVIKCAGAANDDVKVGAQLCYR